MIFILSICVQLLISSYFLASIRINSSLQWLLGLLLSQRNVLLLQNHLSLSKIFKGLLCICADWKKNRKKGSNSSLLFRKSCLAACGKRQQQECYRKANFSMDGQQMARLVGRRPARSIAARISRLNWGVLKMAPMANRRQVSF
jgi:hypothetical protein